MARDIAVMALCAALVQLMASSTAWAQEADEPEEQEPADESGAVEETEADGAEESPELEELEEAVPADDGEPDEQGEGSEEVEEADLCAGVACAGHGRCMVSGGVAVCECDEGFSRGWDNGETCTEAQRESLASTQDEGAGPDTSSPFDGVTERSDVDEGVRETSGVLFDHRSESSLPSNAVAEEPRTRGRRSRRRIVAGSFLTPLGTAAIIGGVAAGLTYGGGEYGEGIGLIAGLAGGGLALLVAGAVMLARGIRSSYEEEQIESEALNELHANRPHLLGCFPPRDDARTTTLRIRVRGGAFRVLTPIHHRDIRRCIIEALSSIRLQTSEHRPLTVRYTLVSPHADSE